MEERINDKIIEIEKYFEELNEATPMTIEEYIQNTTKKRACERLTEIIIEAVEDIAFLLAKEKQIPVSEEDKIFLVLAKNNIISKELALKLKDAKGMRNIIAHEYGRVDDEIVFTTVTEELESDTQEFIKEVNKTLDKAR